MNRLWSSEPQWVSTQYLIKCCLCDTDYFKSLWCYLVVVQLLSCVQLFATPWTAALQAPLSFTVSQSLLKLMSVELVMLSTHLILCCLLLLLPPTFPSIRVFSNESSHIYLIQLIAGKGPDAGKDWGQEEKRVAGDEMVGWHHWLNAHEFEQTLGDSERQGCLECYSSWGHKELRHNLVNEQQQRL